MLLISLGAAASAQAPSATPVPGAAPPFEIRDLKRVNKQRAYVDNAWQQNVLCIEAILRTSEDLGAKKPFARAYFFNREKGLVATVPKPAQVSDDHIHYSAMPDVLRPKEIYKVSFPVTAAASVSGKDRWSHVVVVFGEGERAVADIYPSDDINTYTFPEKTFAVVKRK
jgi:hypothetical protein